MTHVPPKIHRIIDMKMPVKAPEGNLRWQTSVEPD